MPVIEPSEVPKFINLLTKGSLDIDDPPQINQADRTYLTSGDGIADKVQVSNKKIPVTKLKATQKEINASKASGMYLASVQGTFDPADSPVIASADGYIIDGHHRWAALQIKAGKERGSNPRMNVTVIKLPIKKLLLVSNAFTDAIGNKRKSM
jgi:hypothetical protein